MSKSLHIALFSASIGVFGSAQAWAQQVPVTQTPILLQQSLPQQQPSGGGQCTHPAFQGENTVKDQTLSAPSQQTISNANLAIQRGMNLNGPNACGDGQTSVLNADGTTNMTALAINAGMDGLKKNQSLLLGKKGSRRVAASCEGDVGDFTKSLDSCESISLTKDSKTGKRELSKGKVLEMRAELDKLIGQANCKADAAQTAASKLCSFESKYNGLKAAMAELRADLQTDQDLMGQCFNFVKTEVEKEEAKIPTLQQKAKSLETTINRLNEITAAYIGSDQNCSQSGGATCGKVASFRQEIGKHLKAVASFEDVKRQAVAAELTACMNDVSGQATIAGPFASCKGDDNKPVNSLECFARLERDRVLRSRSNSGSGSNRNFNDRDKGAAKEEQDDALVDMRSVLSTMMKNLSKDSAFNLDSSNAGNILQSGYVQSGILNLSKRYGQELANNMQLQLQACSRYAVQEARDDLADDNGKLGSQRIVFEDAQDGLNSKASGMLLDLGKAFREATAEAFNQQPNAAFNALNCSKNFGNTNGNNNISQATQVSQGLNRQAQCVEDLALMMNSLIDGTPPKGATEPVLMPIQGLVVGSDDCVKIGRPSCTCAGFLDCHDVIAKQVIPNVEAKVVSMKGNGSFESKICPNGRCPGQGSVATLGNAWIKGRMDAFGKSFRGLVDNNLRELAALKQQLRSAGLGTLRVPGGPQGKGFKCVPDGESGLCALPDDFTAELSGIAGLSDVDLDALASKSDEAQRKSQELTLKAANLTKIENSIDELEAACTRDDAAKKLEKSFASFSSDADLLSVKCTMGARRQARSGAPSLTGTDAFANMLTALKPTCDDKITDKDPDVKQRCATLALKIEAAQENCEGVFADAQNPKVIMNNALANQQNNGTARNVGDQRLPASNP